MSRFTAGLGGGAGVLLGGVVGIYLGEKFPGRMAREDASVAAGSIGAVLGGALGAAFSAGADCARPGTIGDLPQPSRSLRFP